MPKRAGFWIRTLAAAIDLFVALVLGLILAIALAPLWDRYGPGVERWLRFAYYGGWLAYTSMEISFAATLGKLALGLRITQLDGSRADHWRLTLRWSTKHLWVIATLIYIASKLPAFYLLSGMCSTIVFVGCLFAANDDHLSWHDQWAGTCVTPVRAMVTAPPVLPQ